MTRNAPIRADTNARGFDESLTIDMVVADMRILITGDILRPSPEGGPSQNGNIDWLNRLIGYQIGEAAGRLPETLMGYTETASSLYELLSMQFTIEDWASLYFGSADEQFHEQLSVHFRGFDVVIGFELSPVLMQHLQGLHIPYINCEIAPIRYMDDIFPCFSSNSTQLNVNLEQHRTAAREFQIAANWEALKRGGLDLSVPDPEFCLFIGQVPGDRSQLKRSGFVSARDFENEIKDLICQHEGHFYYKPHPYRGDPVAEELMGRLGVLSVTDNIYNMLSCPRLKTVVAVSSSVLYEAPYFGRRSISLSGITLFSDAIPIHQKFLTTEFWEHVLCNADRIVPPYVGGNILRDTRQSYWGYKR